MEKSPIILDTHTLVWWASDQKQLSSKAVKLIHQADYIRTSAISIWEIALLHQKGRLQFTLPLEDWLSALYQMNLIIIPVDPTIAYQAVVLPGDIHQDPADRIIIATARELNATLITKDRVILDYPYVKAIW